MVNIALRRYLHPKRQSRSKMDVNIYNSNSVKIVELAGELNSDTATSAHNTIIEQIQPGESVLINMTNVSYMSSAGIRTLLLLYRSIRENGGQSVIVGLSEQLEDTLSVTGFLEFFTTRPTVDAGMRAFV